MARQVAPDLMADRVHCYQQRLYQRAGLIVLARQFVAAHGDRVLRGPFAGMRYPPDRIASIPKLLGIYERELHPWIEQALATFERVVNIGAADGYYAVGFARHGLRVDAFESAPTARRELRDLAKLNGVRLSPRASATASKLCRLVTDDERCFVLSDCEGAESDIFTRRVVAKLRDTTVLIETHDGERPGTLATLRDRFAATHDIQVKTETTRYAADLPELAIVAEEDRSRAIDPMRSHPTPWALFSPR
jgi:hypothetical protein